jgi:HK97 family phage major capsid protein
VEDSVSIIRQIGESFEEFKSNNDARLNEIEKLAGRAQFMASTASPRGYDAKDVSELRDIFEGKAMNSLTGADGGYLVPESIRSDIEALVLKQSPIRQVANVIDIATPNTRVPVNLRGATGGWVGENDTRNATASPTLAEVQLPGGTCYALPKISEELIEDAIINLEQFLDENVVDALAENESIAFISGDGTKKPLGFLAGSAPVALADDARGFGTLQYVPSGAASTLGTDIPGTLTKMVLSLRAGYRQADGCAWLMSTDVLSQLANLKDSTGRPIYLPSLADNVPGTLLGYRVVECEHMAGVGAGNFPVAFGNWKRGYTIADRTQLNVLRDPYSEKGQVSFYFRRRVHGALTNSNAIKLLKVAAS